MHGHLCLFFEARKVRKVLMPMAHVKICMPHINTALSGREGTYRLVGSAITKYNSCQDLYQLPTRCHTHCQPPKLSLRADIDTIAISRCSKSRSLGEQILEFSSRPLSRLALHSVHEIGPTELRLRRNSIEHPSPVPISSPLYLSRCSPYRVPPLKQLVAVELARAGFPHPHCFTKGHCSMALSIQQV